MKIGDYVRTEYGIAKIVPDGRFTINDNGNKTIYVDTNGIHSQVEFADYVWSNDIIKSSPNIIDLIEVGDYVNGKYIDEIDINRKRLFSYEKDDYYVFDERDIQSIVTKEQFEKMKYKIGD